MQKKTLIGIMLLTGVFLALSTVAYGSLALAAGITQEVPGNQYSGTLGQGTQTTYRFQQRTQLRLMADVNLTLNLDCDALNIGEQTFEIDVDADADSTLTMNCTETQAELGLMKGQTVQVRNQARNQLGFCANLSLQGGNLIQAQLKIQIKDMAQIHVWAYYDEAKAEWVEVTTTVVDGYAVAETDHFSVWTVLTYDAPFNWLWVLIPVSAVAIVGLVFFMKRRHAQVS